MTVALFSLGGTITMTGTAADGGARPGLRAADLVSGLRSTVDVVAHDVAARPSAALRPHDVVALARTIRDALAAGARGAVVVQGTDTLEETAYLLDLLHEREEPIVVTGAMRPATAAGPDGPANLAAAVEVAAAPDARGLGCLVVLADEIHAARLVHKAHTSHVAAFTAPGFGPIGHVVEGVASIPLVPRVRRTIDPDSISRRDPRVALVTLGLGTELTEAIGRDDGLVVAAFGGGHVPPASAGVLGTIAGRIPVVLASRAAGGAVLTTTYGFAGSERDLLSRGLVGAGHLGALKARVLLWALLASDPAGWDASRFSHYAAL